MLSLWAFNFTINFHYAVNKVFSLLLLHRPCPSRLMTFRAATRAFTRLNNSRAIDATQQFHVNRTGAIFQRGNSFAYFAILEKHLEHLVFSSSSLENLKISRRFFFLHFYDYFRIERRILSDVFEIKMQNFYQIRKNCTYEVPLFHWKDRKAGKIDKFFRRNVNFFSIFN